MTTRPLGATLRPAAGWQILLGLYVGLTAWILLGRGLATDPLFTGVKNGGYVVTMIVGVWVFRDAFARSWRTTRRRPLLAVGGVLLGLALMALASGLSQGLMLFVAAPATGENQAAIADEVLAASGSLIGGLFFVVIGGVVAPVVEELVFRELPFTWLRHIVSTRTAFVLSCVVFGVIHLRGLEEWPLAVLYVGFSVALATVYLLSERNLLVPIAAHVLWNATGLTYLILAAA